MKVQGHANQIIAFFFLRLELYTEKKKEVLIKLMLHEMCVLRCDLSI